MLRSPIGSAPPQPVVRGWLLVLLIVTLLAPTLPALLRPARFSDQSDSREQPITLDQSSSRLRVEPADPVTVAGPSWLPYPEIETLRGPHSSHYDMGNGEYAALVSLSPLHYQDVFGDWQPIDPAFAPIDGGWQVQANSLRSTVADRATAVQLEHQGVLIAWEPQALQARLTTGAVAPLAAPLPPEEAAAGALAANGRTLSYSGAWDDPTLTELLHSRPGEFEQELVLSEPPRALANAEWLELHATLTMPEAVLVYADGQPQSGPFTTDGPLELRTPDGETLLTLAPPVAYEQAQIGERVAGRYAVQREERTITLAVQTPWSWWASPERTYPAVLDPTMQVVRTLEQITIQEEEVLSDAGVAQPAAPVFQAICPGHFVRPEVLTRGYRRSYVRFPLPTLPNGVTTPQAAALVAVPERNGDDPTYTKYADQVTRTPLIVHRATEDWSSLLSASSVASGDYPATTNVGGSQEIVFKPNPGLTLDRVLATSWDVSSMVQGWYDGTFENYGFGLILREDQFHFFKDELQPTYGGVPGRFPSGACFPSTAGWSDLDGVFDDEPTQSADGPGLALLINYTAPTLPDATIIGGHLVPSVHPLGRGGYQDKYHEYRLPSSSRWRLIATQGRPDPSVGSPTNYPYTPLTLVDDAGDLLTDSDAGTATPGNESFEWQPNYIVLDGNQPLPADVFVRVEPDGKPTGNHSDKLYTLEIDNAAPSPALSANGSAVTIPIQLLRELIDGQELDLPGDATVEIRIPYDEVNGGSNPFSKDDARAYNIQLFAPGGSDPYASRTQGGAQLTAGPDAWEIELSLNAAQAGTWLLAINYDHGRRDSTTMNANVTVCPNSDDVVRYPLDGECVELRRPPATLTVGSTYQEIGNLRIYSPGGFTGTCPTNCTTNSEDPAMIPVMPLLGYTGDDDHWVALKGGTFTLTNAGVTTSADTRLVMADFSDPDEIVSMPVLRGDFSASGTGSILETVSAAADTYLLVNSPLHASDDTGFSYEIDLGIADDVLRSEGTLQRTIRPTSGEPAVSFSFAANWSIAVQGGSSLQGQVTYQSVSRSPFNVGSLLVSPPTTGYGLEHNPADAKPFNPAFIPKFRQIRMVGGTLAQPESTGAAELPVQGVLLIVPGALVKDIDPEGGVRTIDNLECGANSHVCFDLRGEADTAPPRPSNVDREYRMPDLIIQDEANTVMLNTAEGVDIRSTDHPNAGLAQAGGVNFSYEAYNAGVRTFRGPCPLPRDPLNPDQGGGAGPETTIIEGSAGMSIPNAGSSGGTSGGPEISVKFILCETALRELRFTFDTGDNTAIPLGNSGLFLNFFSGTVSIAPPQPMQDSYVTVVLEVRFRGFQPTAAASTLLARGVVTIDSRGLFDVQVNAGVQVFAGLGVGIDGHFWVAWSPLDMGFIVEACVPFSSGFDASTFPSSGVCSGTELLYGMFKAHMWQGQGWQNRYSWLPDDDAMHMTARFEARIQLSAGFIIDWGLVKLPPGDITLAGLKLAFGEFCINQACTEYEWGVMGAFTFLGYDIGAYYGFDTGISFILGSADHVLIDEAGAVGTALADVSRAGLAASPPGAGLQNTTTAITVTDGIPAAMFGLAWSGPQPTFELQEPGPGGRTITPASAFADVTTDVSPTSAGSTQAIITVADPQAGVWDANVTNVDPTTEYRFFYFANRPEPTVTLSFLPSQTNPDNTVVLTWTSTVRPDDDLRISFYYEKVTTLLTNTQEIGGPIVEHLPLESTGVYTWDLEGLVSGSYAVYARLENNMAAIINNTTAISQAYSADPLQQPPGSTMLDPSLTLVSGDILQTDSTVRYRDVTPPDPPTNIAARPEGISSLMVRWQPNDERDLSGYIVTCQQGTLERQVRVTAIQPATSTLSETARVNGLNAVPADCSVQAYDASLNLSMPSLSATATPSGTIPLPPAMVLTVEAVQTPLQATVVLVWPAVEFAAGYYVYYQPLLGLIDDDTALAQAGSNPSYTASYSANEGRSPINVGNVTETTLTGLRPGITYEAWVRAYDADGRVGDPSPPVRVVAPQAMASPTPTTTPTPSATPTPTNTATPNAPELTATAGGPTLTPTSTPTTTPTPSATPTPTNTATPNAPELTATAGGPTLTPTSTPTSTPVSGPTGNERVYLPLVRR